MSDTSKPEREEAFYFCDESSYAGEEIMAVAGLALPKRNLKAVVAEIKSLHKTKQREEVKWNTTKIWNLEIRRDHIDCLADLTTKRLVHLHVRFAPFDQYDHEQSGRRRIYDTVGKMYYQLLLHRAVRHYGPQYRLLIRPDDGACTSELKKFVAPLCFDGHIKYRAKPDCIKDLVCLNSEKEPLLQLLDVTLGALTAYRNGRHLKASTSKAKSELAAHTVKAFKIKNIAANWDDGRRLSIWNVIPSRKRGPRS
jgi:hypothetical protein